MYVYVCVRTCVRARARACVCECVCVVFFCRIVSNFKMMKTLTLLVHDRCYFLVSVINRTLTWTTGPLTCVCGLFLHAHTHGGTSVYSLIRRTFVESMQNVTPEESQGGRKDWHITVTHPFGDHAPSCLYNLVFESEYSCSAPPNTVITRMAVH